MNLLASQKTTQSVPAGQILAIVAEAGTTGSVIRLAIPEGGEPYSPVPIAGASLTFGPYSTAANFRIECSVGEVVVSVASPDPFAVHPTLAAYATTAATVNALSALHLYGAGAPVNYTDGDPVATGEGTSPKGAIYSDTTNGFVYRNSGTQAQPIWTKLGDAV